MLTPAEMEVLALPDLGQLSVHDQSEHEHKLARIHSATFVLAPVRADHPSHWTLLWALRQQVSQPWQLHYYDALPEQTQTCYQAACRAARNLTLLAPGQDLPASAPGEQKDGWSCGAWVLRQMEIQMRTQRGELPTLPPSITQVIARVNFWIQKLHEAPAPKAKAKGKAKAAPEAKAPPVPDLPKTLEEALQRGLACKKCRPSIRQPVKGCSQCMGPFFEEIRQKTCKKVLMEKM